MRESGSATARLSVFVLCIASFLVLSSIANAATFGSRDPEKIKCGTFNPDFVKYIRGGSGNRINFEGDTIAILQCTTFSTNKHFRIIYDTSQAPPSAEYPFERKPVPLWDDNHNGIPDFVDSLGIFLERAYDFYDKIGYHKPYCGFAGIPSTYTDVFLLNIGEGQNTAYGYTAQYDTRLPNGKKPTYIFMDNDYSAKDSTWNYGGEKQRTYKDTGCLAQKITAAHEFHHCIQMSYPEEFAPYSKFAEITSTGMEVRLYPETTDYIVFVQRLFRDFSQRPITDTDAAVGYAWSILSQYIVHEFGDSLWLRFWEMSVSGKPDFVVLDSAFRERGTTLPAEWCKFMDWIYFTGVRAIDGEFFPQARLFPTSFQNRVDGKYNFGLYNYSEPSTGENGSLIPFDLRGVKIVFPSTQLNREKDTCLFILTNTNIQEAVEKTRNPIDYSLVCSSQQTSGSLKLGNLNYFYSQIGRSNYLCDHFYVNAGVLTEEPESAYPNPFRSSVHSEIFFPVPNNAETGNKVRVVILSADMVVLEEFTALVETGKNTHMHDTPVFAKVARWNEIGSKLSSGVYLYQVHYEGELTFGKFAVRK